MNDRVRISTRMVINRPDALRERERERERERGGEREREREKLTEI